MEPPVKQQKTEDDSTIETYSIVWLDSSVNVSEENIAAQAKLRIFDPNLKLYKDDHECEDYIKSQSNIKSFIILIVNGSLGEKLVPRVNDLEHIISIYVYCIDKERHKIWANTYSKVKNVVTQFTELEYQIQINHFNKTSPIIEEPENHKQNTGFGQYELDASHKISDISLDYLSQIKPTPNDKDEFVSLCQEHIEDNSRLTEILQEFQEKDAPDKILSLFNKDQLFNRILLKGFQYLNIEIMYRSRYFIRNMQKQFEKHKCSSSVKVFRGQTMSHQHLQQIKDFKGKIIGIRSVLSTTFDRQIAMLFIDNKTPQNGVLFEIDANPQIEDAQLFVKTSPTSHSINEDGVLFMIGSLFKLNEICEDENGITILKMELCADKDINSIKKELNNNKEEKDFIGFIQLQYNLSLNLNYPKILDNADKLLEKYANELSENDLDHIRCYDLLGAIADAKNDLDTCLNWHKKSLEFKQKRLPSTDPRISQSYYCIAAIYSRKNEYTQALDEYNKVLTIWKQASDDYNQILIGCYVQMIEIYENIGKFIDVLSCYTQIFNIMLKHFAIDDINLAPIYNNMGKTFFSLGQYSLALGYYETSLDIKLKHQCSNNYIAGNYKSIGYVYQRMGNLDQARIYFEKAATKYRETSSENSDIILEIEQLIRNLYTSST